MTWCFDAPFFSKNRRGPRHIALIIGSMWQAWRILVGHHCMSHYWQDLQTRMLAHARVRVCVNWNAALWLLIISTSYYKWSLLLLEIIPLHEKHTQYPKCKCVVSHMWVPLVLKHPQLKANCRLTEVPADAVFLQMGGLLRSSAGHCYSKPSARDLSLV